MMRSFWLTTLLLSSMLTAQIEVFLDWGLEEGLAQSQVNDLHQDADGFLWAATVGGLSRYDGRSFQNFYKDDGLGDNDVSCIAEVNGTMIFGTQGGITIYEGQRFSHFPLPQEADVSRVTHMSHSEDRLWVGTSDQGLHIFSLSERIFIEHQKVWGERIRFTDARKGWVAPAKGLFMNGLLIDSLFAEVRITDMVSNGKEAWASSLRDGLFHFTNGGWRPLTIPITDAPSSYRDLCFDGHGRLWAVSRDGILKQEDGHWTLYDERNGLDYTNIRAVHEDREGNIWFATNGQGIYRYTGGLFMSYVQDRPLPHPAMLSCEELPDQGMLMGMFNEGLLRMPSIGEIEQVTGIPSTDIWSMCRDRSGRVWIGASSGLYSYLNGEVTTYDQNGLSDLRITRLHLQEQKLFIGHRDGAITLDLEDMSTEDLLEDFTLRRVRAIDAWGDTLVIGAENGLFLYYDGQVSPYTESQGLNDNTIYCVAAHGQDLFIGSKTGLHRLRSNGEIERLKVSLTAASSPVNLLHRSPIGHLFIGTNQGLYLSVDPSAEQPIFKSFGRTEGLPGLEFNLNAVHQKGDTIWMGLSNAVIRFQESALVDWRPELAPRMAFRSMLLFAEPFDIKARSDSTGVLLFQNQENHLSFDFHGIWLARPAGLLYSYRLMGVDEAWSKPSDIHRVTYSDLGFGDYRFEARAVDAQGEVISQTIGHSFHIDSPWFLKPWAILIAMVLLFVMAAGIISWRRAVSARRRASVELGFTQRLYALEQQSLNSNMNRHFIFNALNAIQFYINREDKRSANRYLSRFAKLIRKNLDSTSHTWVKLQDEIERLELYLELEKMRFKDRFDYHIHMHPDIDSGKMKVPGMMLQPFFENSIWHGLLPKEEKGLVSMRIEPSGEGIHIIIEDDGVGIEESRAQRSRRANDHESRGMDITQHRVELLAKMTGSRFEMNGPYQIEEDGTVLGTRTELIISGPAANGARRNPI